MKYIRLYLKLAVLACCLLGTAGVAIAQSTDGVIPQTGYPSVDPLNAMIATLIAIVAGLALYSFRQRGNV